MGGRQVECVFFVCVSLLPICDWLDLCVSLAPLIPIRVYHLRTCYCMICMLLLLWLLRALGESGR